MPRENPRITETAMLGWRDAFAAFFRMPLVFGTAILAVLLLNVVTLPLMPPPKQDPGLADHAIGGIVAVVQGFLMTPVAIAVHRFVLLDELTPNYALRPTQLRFMRFFAFTVVFQLLMTVPAIVMSATGKAGGWVAGIGGFVGFVLFVAAVILSLRLLILFPAIAVDTPGARWNNALLDSKGTAWRTFSIALLCSLPMIAAMLPLYYLLAWPDGPGMAGGIALSLAQAAIGVFGIAAFAAIASHLFAAYSDRLNERQ